MVNSKSVVSGMLLLVLFASLSFGQLDTGTISGTLADQSGAAVPGATLVVDKISPVHGALLLYHIPFATTWRANEREQLRLLQYRGLAHTKIWRFKETIL